MMMMPLIGIIIMELHLKNWW